MGANFQLLRLRLCLALLLLFLGFHTVYGKQIPTVVGILKTDPSFFPNVTVGMPSAINTILVPSIAGTKDYKIQNTISLKYDLNTDTFFLAQTNVRVEVLINRWNASNAPLPTFTRFLTISINNKLNKPILEESTVNLNGGYKITMQIKKIWINGVPVNTLPRYVSVESEINMDRYYDFSTPGNTTPLNTQLLATDKDCDGLNDELQVTWSTPSAVPEEYQLEWTYVSNYSQSGGSYPASTFFTDFKNNSTRITTTSNSYKISLIYPDGYIAFRVRAVGRNYLNPTEYMYGPWNVADQVNMGSLSATYKYAVIGHEKIKNWQYSSNYAEEGKRKEVISYFDGSLHNRQTVTKINSDKNVIVGETMYDFQGRPAVNVLPVPINFNCATPGSEPVVKYYTKFNVDDTNKVYSKNDFDLDAGGLCNPSAAPMDTIAGASKYYSTNNPNKNLQQGYLPHAKEYPFTQVEYTPDNTGRVRSQSGLGKDYKLGSGKETKYLYGQPNQIQVDRLFGSETGDASHYKKNVVIDANGQTSVTYLNQEGKTIVTALAGTPPTIGGGSTTRLDSLDYAAQNQTPFTIDLFNKNALGVSNLNSIPPSNDQLNFSTQLLVPFRSAYDFSYNLDIAVLPDACLRAGVCFSCIYDMEIHITDECGVDLVSSVSPFKPIKRVTGNVDTTGNKLTFNTNCSTPLLKDSAKVSLVLQPGVYTVSKILKVNQQAKDFYVKKYIDSVYNSCVMTLSQFQAAELAQIDTSDCYNTCASCVTALGLKDDFVSTGKGTSEQWDFLVAQCNEPCRQKTLCQVTYELLLSDVSPGGQYGKYNPATFDASSEPISVYNVGNVLNPNTIPSQQANWKAPLMLLNGSVYNMYLDENGVRTKVFVTQSSPGVFQPPVTSPSLVYFDNVTNLQYTYPENLQNLSDFIAIWNANYAKSLVVFHPEYAYYVSCSEQAIKFPGENLSSDGLDSLLFATENFNQAVTAGFVKSNYLTVTPPTNRINTIWLTPTGNYDPFFTNSTFQYSTVFNPVTGAQTSTNMTGAAIYNVNLQTEMNTVVTNYRTIGATPYSMVEIAALITRCGNNFGSSAPTAACLDFGKDFYTTPPYAGANDTIRNREWRVYRQLYFSEKQKLQFKRMNFYAKYCNGLYSNYYGGCNACIGKSGYDVFNSGMVTLNGSSLPDPNSPFFDTSQPCGASSSSNYPGAVKRFYDPANTGLNTISAGQNIYQTTGQCPLAFQLQNFLNSMAASSSLTPNSINLNQVGAFTPDLYNAVNAGIVPPAFINYSWQPSITGSTLTANIVDPGTSTIKCVIKLNITGTGIPAFTNITGINQLVYDVTSGNIGAFKAVVVYVVGSSTLSANATGTSSCMDIKNCSFSTQCAANQFGIDMSNLFSYLQASGLLSSTSAIPISSNSVLNSYLTTTIKNTLGTPNSNIVYQFVSPYKLNIYDISNATTKIIFTYTVNPSSSAANIKTFNNFQSSAPNFYTMDGLDINNVKIATISGSAFKATSSQTVDLSLGTCDIVDPIECSEVEHQVREDLEGLVNEILRNKPFNSNVDLYNLVSFTPLLKSFESPAVNSTSSTYAYGATAMPNYDTLIIRFATTPANTYSTCNFKLYHYRNNSTILNFTDIVGISQLTGIGSPDLAGNYFHFKAQATYVVGTNAPVSDTIYGYSCWPLKNCNYCNNPISISSQPSKTYSYSTGFDRVSNAPYGSTNYGNFNPYWTITKTQPLTATAPYVLTGSPTNLNPIVLAYDINTSSYGVIQMPGCNYASIFSIFPSYSTRQSVTYKTTFTLPNPLPNNKSYSLSINTRADDAIFRVSVNGSNLFIGSGGGAYSGLPVSVGVNSQISGLLAGGVNTIEIDAVDIGLSAYGMVAQVLLKEYDKICDNGPPDSTFVFPPYTKYDNPCVKQKINLALQNAANSYNQYINSITTTFADTYSKHCLSALEKFTYKYVDKEYHHTLYYYDQAGNLIKTIPPAGLEYLPITKYTDNLEKQIISDRTNGQQNVFTTHRMATKYVYNSLNQLILQSVPDHDNLDVCEGANPNGLDTGLVINAIQFVTPSKGYLCGEIKKSGVSNRGYVYTTNDAGNSWTRLNGVTSGDLQKVQFVSTTLGYAVSNFGMVFKTIDGGNTWDLQTGLYTMSPRYVEVLNDLYFTSATSGVVGGIALGSNAPIFYTTNGGITYLPASVTGVVAGDTITGFAFDGTTYVASAKNGISGKQFSSTNGTSWTLVNFAANNLKKVQFISNSLAYAVGEEGTLLKLSQPISGNPVFQLVPTGILGSFTDVYFKNATDGVAIIDSIPGSGKIFKTFNGGITWQLLSADGDYYNSLQLYDATNQKLIAAGKMGLIAKILLGNSPFGIVKIATPNLTNYSFADAYDNGANGLVAIGVSDITTSVITCYNAQLTNPSWYTASTAGSIPGIDARFKKIILLDSSASTPYIKGVLLTKTGKLYSFFRKHGLNMTFQAVSLPAPGATGKFFVDITTNSQAFTSTIYAFDTISKRNYKISFSGSLASGVVINNIAPITRNVNAIDINNAGNTVLIVGNSGHIRFANNILAPSTAWNDVSLMTLPVAVTKVRAVSTNNFIATGIDGAIWKNSGNATTWYLLNSGTVSKFNSISVDNTGKGLVAANNGKLFQLTNAQTMIPTLSNITTGLAANLTDVAIQPAGSSAYATAMNGQVLYMTNYLSPVPVLASSASPFSANGIAYKAGPNALVVGNNVLIANYYGTNVMSTKDIFTKGLISTHFYDSNIGYVIDSNNVVRRTSDGGITWSVILPIQGAQLTKVHATQSNAGVLIGLNKFAAGINGLNLSNLTIPGTIPGGTHFYDIDYNSTKTYGFIVGSNTRAAKIVGNTVTDVGQAQTTAIDFRAVHVFNNNTFIASGTKGVIYYYKNGGYTPQMNYIAPAFLFQSNITLRDIFFHDYYSGYVVGSNGAFFRVELNDSIGTKGLTANALPWEYYLCYNSVYMNYTTNSQVAKLDFRAIACSDRFNLMIGGADTNVVISTFKPNRYARLIKVQTSNFSTRFWYDKLGRLVLSQNIKQFKKINPANSSVTQAYSYTLYDALGRITEVGEKFENPFGAAAKINNIFGSFVNGHYNNSMIDDAKFMSWINGWGVRQEVTKTYYDSQSILIAGTQNNLRKRVATITYEDVYDGNNLTYNHATHYSYDIHGNVSTVWQENTQLAVSGQSIKQMDYQYDLISGKVNKVIYSPGQIDQFIHRYTYDADNRITSVETSSNDRHYDLEAKYFYYAHGALARIEYGKNQVQGIDYAYTLQGWIKGVNSNVLKKAKDMGSDGDLSFANPNGNFARDIAGYSLNYYKGDYEAINYVKWNSATTRFEAYKTSSDLLANSNDLFNGNISSMVTTISKVDTNSSGVVTGSSAFPLGNGYRYDQLNRIKRSYSYTNLDTLTNTWLGNGASTAGLYRNTFTYDANGNILTQVKRDSIGGLIDSLVYNYEKLSGNKLIRNRLYHVNDFVTSTPANFGDIKDQGAFTSGASINLSNNYSFDEIGNLIKDNAEQIDTIRWTVYGKIKAIIRASASTKDNLFFDYDAGGNRIAKHVYTSANVWKYSTYYLRDVQGNVMGVYNKKIISSAMSYKLDEHQLYGSSRIGVRNSNIEMIGAPAPTDTTKSYLGLKNYELSNHLGNVLSVISDKKIAIANPSLPNKIGSYVTDLVSSTDYYAFGQVLYGRNNRVSSFRYGFNGKENDNEVKGIGNQIDYGLRAYDPRIGRFMSGDPLTSVYPDLSPYQYASNTPIAAKDIDGAEADAKFDGMQRNTRKAAMILYPGDAKKQQAYIFKAAQDRAIGAAAGGAVLLAVAAAPEVAAVSVRGLIWASANPEAAIMVSGVVGGFFYEGPEDIVPNSNADDLGRAFRGLFKAPIADARNWLKFAGVENATFIKGSNGGMTAVIGQGMEKVNKVAGGIKNALTFTPSDAAMSEWKEILKNAKGGQVADDIVKGTKVFAENKAWIENVKNQGYNILDTGGGTNSTFYNMEKEAIYGEKKK